MELKYSLSQVCVPLSKRLGVIENCFSAKSRIAQTAIFNDEVYNLLYQTVDVF